MPQLLAKQLLERGGELWNMYGPTETTIWSTLCHITPEDTNLPDWPTDCQHPGLRPGQPFTACALRCEWVALYRRRRSGARLLGSARSDSRKFHYFPIPNGRGYRS